MGRLGALNEAMIGDVTGVIGFGAGACVAHFAEGAAEAVECCIEKSNDGGVYEFDLLGDEAGFRILGDVLTRGDQHGVEGTKIVKSSVTLPEGMGEVVGNVAVRLGLEGSESRLATLQIDSKRRLCLRH